MPLICPYAQFTFVNIHSSILFTFRSKCVLVCISFVQDKWGWTHVQEAETWRLCLHSKENQRLFENWVTWSRGQPSEHCVIEYGVASSRGSQHMQKGLFKIPLNICLEHRDAQLRDPLLRIITLHQGLMNIDWWQRASSQGLEWVKKPVDYGKRLSRREENPAMLRNRHLPLVSPN